MGSKDIFKLAVRILGLVFLYHALRSVQPALALIIASFPHAIGNGYRTSGSFANFAAGFFTVAWPLLVAYWLLRGAPLVIRLAYPDAPASTRAETTAEAGTGYRGNV